MKEAGLVWFPAGTSECREPVGGLRIRLISQCVTQSAHDLQLDAGARRASVADVEGIGPLQVRIAGLGRFESGLGQAIA